MEGSCHGCWCGKKKTELWWPDLMQAAATGGASAPGGGNMVKMEARVFGCVEMKMMTWKNVIGSNSLVEIKSTWHVLVGQF